MTELFITYAKVMPEESSLNELSKALEEYRLTKNKESKERVTMYSSIIMIKFTTKNKSVGTVLNDVAQKKNILDTFSPDKD